MQAAIDACYEKLTRLREAERQQKAKVEILDSQFKSVRDRWYETLDEIAELQDWISSAQELED